MIFNVLRFTTCQAILRAARKTPLTVEGRKVRFLPDYSSYTLKRRLAFSQAMDNARAKGVEFFLLYPAILKIKVGGRVESFDSPKDAEDFIHTLPVVLPLSSADDGVPVETEGANDADSVALEVRQTGFYSGFVLGLRYTFSGLDWLFEYLYFPSSTSCFEENIVPLCTYNVNVFICIITFWFNFQLISCD